MTAAQTLMVIVIQAGSYGGRKEIGFVSEGLAAQVKVDTFNFTKYGLIEAQIESISDDAIKMKFEMWGVWGLT